MPKRHDDAAQRCFRCRHMLIALLCFCLRARMVAGGYMLLMRLFRFAMLRASSVL